MKLRDDIILHDIAGDRVALMKLDQGKTRAISFNNTSEYLWNELKGKDFSAEDVATKLQEKYGIDAHTSLTDAKDWIEELKNNGLIA